MAALACVAHTAQEVLFAPLTGLEVRSSYVEGSVLVFEISISINLKALTIEEARFAFRHHALSRYGKSLSRLRSCVVIGCHRLKTQIILSIFQKPRSCGHSASAQYPFVLYPARQRGDMFGHFLHPNFLHPPFS